MAMNYEISGRQIRGNIRNVKLNKEYEFLTGEWMCHFTALCFAIFSHVPSHSPEFRLGGGMQVDQG